MSWNFESVRLGLVCDWTTHGPEWEILLARESDLPDWGTLRPAVFAAPFARIYWNEGGPIDLELAGGTTRLAAGTFAVIGPETHYVPRRAGRKVRHCYLHLGIAWPWTMSPGVWILKNPGGGTARMLLGDLRKSGRGSPVPAEYLLAHAVAGTVLSALPASAWATASTDPGINRAVQEIQRSPAHPPANASLAAMLGLTVDAFIRRFRRATGKTPQAFSLNHRLSEAARLLAHTGDSMEEIAEATGFLDRYHFTKAFHRARGVPPGVWRRHVRGHGNE